MIVLSSAAIQNLKRGGHKPLYSPPQLK